MKSDIGPWNKQSKRTMESPYQQPDPNPSRLPNDVTASESAQLSQLSPAPGINQKSWSLLGRQVSDWLGQLPESLARLWNQYRQALISVALILAAIIALRLVLAVLNAVNGIWLLQETLELVGISYSAWFAWRYLLKKSTRQELSQEIQGILNR